MTQYNKNKYDKLKIKFKDSEKINNNFSQAYQDMFILTVLNGKQNGTFVEIGAHDPISINNTFILESQFNWNGISIDIDQRYQSAFQNAKRSSNFVLQDALSIDYSLLFKQYNCPKQIDYLQIDIEPCTQTFNCLCKIPFVDYRFSVITFETDYYDNNIPLDIRNKVKNESRRILESYGYVLLAGDVCATLVHPFEDWWVDPSVVSIETINTLKVSSNFNNLGENVLLIP